MSRNLFLIVMIFLLLRTDRGAFAASFQYWVGLHKAPTTIGILDFDVQPFQALGGVAGISRNGFGVEVRQTLKTLEERYDGNETEDADRPPDASDFVGSVSLFIDLLECGSDPGTKRPSLYLTPGYGQRSASRIWDHEHNVTYRSDGLYVLMGIRLGFTRTRFTIETSLYRPLRDRGTEHGIPDADETAIASERRQILSRQTRSEILLGIEVGAWE